MLKRLIPIVAALALCLCAGCGTAVQPSPAPSAASVPQPTATPQPSFTPQPEDPEYIRLYPEALLPFFDNGNGDFGIVDIKGNVLFEPCFGGVFYINCTGDALERFGEKPLALHRTLRGDEKDKWQGLLEGEGWTDMYGQDALTGESYILFPLSGKLFGPFPGRVADISAERAYLRFYGYEGYKVFCYPLEGEEIVFEAEGQEIVWYDKDYMALLTQEGWQILDRAGNVRAIEAEGRVALIGNLAVVYDGGDYAVRMVELDTGVSVLPPAGITDIAGGGGSFLGYMRDGMWGVMRRDGSVVIEAQYNSFSSWDDGYAALWRDEHMLLYDIRGEEPALRFDSAQWEDITALWYESGGIISIIEGENLRLFNAESGTVEMFGNGFYLWGTQNSLPLISNSERTALFSRAGGQITPWHDFPRYSYYSENTIVFADTDEKSQDANYAYDLEGNLLFTSAGSIYQLNDFFFAVSRGSAYGVIYKDGEWVYRSTEYRSLND